MPWQVFYTAYMLLSMCFILNCPLGPVVKRGDSIARRLEVLCVVIVIGQLLILGGYVIMHTILAFVLAYGM